MGVNYLDTRAALFADPFPHESDQGVFDINEDTFYSELYIEPVTALEEARACIEQGVNSIRMVHINGYAGSGKTLLAHKIMRTYGCGGDFSYAFGTGEEESLQLGSIVDRMLIELAQELCIHWSADRYESVLRSLSLICEKPPEKAILRSLAWGDIPSLAGRYGERGAYADLKNRLRSIVDVVGFSDELSHGANLSAVNWKIRFLLYLDYCWRLSDASKEARRRAFCLLDNIDGLSLESVVVFYVDVHDVMSRIRSRQRALETPSGFSFVYLFPTREVTKRKLDDGLSRKYRARAIRDKQLLVQCDLTGIPHSEIAFRRISYWKRVPGIVRQSELLSVETLIRSSAFDRVLAPLMNSNYIESVSRVIDILESYPALTRELAAMQVRKQELVGEPSELVGAGERGLLLRLVFEFFKSKGVYDSPLSADGSFNEISKLGLAPLYSAEWGEAERDESARVTTSRMVLTVLDGSDGFVSLSDLTELLGPSVSADEICATLFAMCRNLREVWRRMVMFTSDAPPDYASFRRRCELSLRDGRPGPLVEICLSGKTYLRHIAPSFEFYLSRIDSGSGLASHPPLFSEASMRGLEDSTAVASGAVKCFESIEYVLRSIEACAPSLYGFGTMTVERFTQPANSRGQAPLVDKLSLLFCRSSRSEEVRHTHLSRIVFSHVGYLERFRRYRLFIARGPIERLSESANIAFNERMIGYMIRYLMLFDSAPFQDNGGFRELLDNRYLPPLIKKVPWRSTCVEMLREVCETLGRSQYSRFLSEVENGVKGQARSQKSLLKKMLDVHRSGYRLVGKVEIDLDDE